jgi:hypothetical protein
VRKGREEKGQVFVKRREERGRSGKGERKETHPKHLGHRIERRKLRRQRGMKQHVQTHTEMMVATAEEMRKVTSDTSTGDSLQREKRFSSGIRC